MNPFIAFIKLPKRLYDTANSKGRGVLDAGEAAQEVARNVLHDHNQFAYAFHAYKLSITGRPDVVYAIKGYIAEIHYIRQTVTVTETHGQNPTFDDGQMVDPGIRGESIVISYDHATISSGQLAEEIKKFIEEQDTIRRLG